MATETGGGMSDHLRGVTVTTLSTGAGLLAGWAASILASGPKDSLGLSILAFAVIFQLPVLYGFGIDPRDFSTKDNLYVVFMTLTTWFIVWTVLMSAGSA